MTTYDELGNATKRFLAGGPLLPLREWLEGYDAPVSASSDQRFRVLSSDVWTLISECDLGERTESEARSALMSSHPELALRRKPTLVLPSG